MSSAPLNITPILFVLKVALWLLTHLLLIYVEFSKLLYPPIRHQPDTLQHPLLSVVDLSKGSSPCRVEPTAPHPAHVLCLFLQTLSHQLVDTNQQLHLDPEPKHKHHNDCFYIMVVKSKVSATIMSIQKALINSKKL